MFKCGYLGCIFKFSEANIFSVNLGVEVFLGEFIEPVDVRVVFGCWDFSCDCDRVASLEVFCSLPEDVSFGVEGCEGLVFRSFKCGSFLCFDSIGLWCFKFEEGFDLVGDDVELVVHSENFDFSSGFDYFFVSVLTEDFSLLFCFLEECCDGLSSAWIGQDFCVSINAHD